MKKGLGIDLGPQRAGIAVGTFRALEYDTINFTHIDQLCVRLIEIIKKEEIDYLVIGKPLGQQYSSSLNSIEEQIKQIESKISIPIYFTDETLTTKQAEQILKQEKTPWQEIKKRSDQASAKIILQQYIDENI